MNSHGVPPDEHHRRDRRCPPDGHTEYPPDVAAPTTDAFTATSRKDTLVPQHPPADRTSGQGGHDRAGSPAHHPGRRGDTDPGRTGDRSPTAAVWPGTLPAAVRIARLAVADQRYGHARALLATHLPGADLQSADLRDLIDAAHTYAAATRPHTGHKLDTTAGALPLEVAVDVAEHLIGNGSRANRAAAALLETYLAGLDPDLVPAVPALIDAATRYAVVAPDRRRAHAWAQCGYRVSRTVCEPYDDRCTYALHVLATSLALQGQHGDAVDLCRDHLVSMPWAPPGPVSQVRMCLAEALHAGGRCGEAIREATTALHEWPDTNYDPDSGYAIMAVRAAAMLAGCGRHREAVVCVMNAIPAFPPTGSAARRNQVARAIRAIQHAQSTHRDACARARDVAYGLAPAADPDPVTISDICRELLT